MVSFRITKNGFIGNGSGSLTGSLLGTASHAITASSVAWNDVTGKPSAYPAAAHNHTGDHLKPASVTTTGDITVGGNLIVNGSQTVIKTKNLTVKDKLIEIASGSPTPEQADGAGIAIQTASAATQEGREAASARIQYRSSDNHFTASIGFVAPSFTGSLQGTATSASFALDHYVPTQSVGKTVNAGQVISGLGLDAKGHVVTVTGSNTIASASRAVSAESAEKLSTSNVGGLGEPVYFKNGVPVADKKTKGVVDWVTNNSESLLTPDEVIWKKGTGTDSAVRVLTGDLETTTPSATGIGAVAIGLATVASETSSHAEGMMVVASGIGSHAEGQTTEASGFASHAEGLYTTASGDYSHAEGSGSIASGRYSHAEGLRTTASGVYSHVEGYGTDAGDYSHAEGTSTKASGTSNHAEGLSTEALGYASHAEGCSTTASGDYSHAEGFGTTTSNIHEHAQGMYNHTSSNQIFSIGAGESNTSRRNAVSVLAVKSNNNKYTASVFVQNIGGYNGTNPTPGTNDLATVIGKVSSIWKKSEGIDSVVQKLTGIYEANTPTATKGGAIATGYATTASGIYSHAEGRGTIASGDGSHAEGSFTTSSGDDSHAEGQDTNASGEVSHAEGLITNASGIGSHAEGVLTIATNMAEHAQGMFNHSSENQIFSVGAGETINEEAVNRRNAISVLAVPNADTKINTASFFVQNIGGYDGTNPTPGTNDLATVINGITSNAGTVTSVGVSAGTGITASVTNNTTTPIISISSAQAHTHSNKAVLDGITAAMTASWTSKQNAIDDLATIRSKANNGQKAYDWGNHASAGYVKSGDITTAINDLVTVSGSKWSTDTKVTSADNHYKPTQAGTSGSSTARYYIKTIGVDSRGHVTSVTTGHETVENTDTKVTSVGNHYTPEQSTAKAASAGSVISGIGLDAKGHVTSITSSNSISNATNATNATIATNLGVVGNTSASVAKAIAEKWTYDEDTIKGVEVNKAVSATKLVGTSGSEGVPVYISAGVPKACQANLVSLPLSSTGATSGTVTLAPGKVHNCGTLTGNLTINLDRSSTDSHEAIYCCVFNMGSTLRTIKLPAGVKVVENSADLDTAGVYYEINIMNDVAIIARTAAS